MFIFLFLTPVGVNRDIKSLIFHAKVRDESLFFGGWGWVIFWGMILFPTFRLGRFSFGGQYRVQEFSTIKNQNNDSRKHLLNFFPYGSPCTIFLSEVFTVQDVFLGGNCPPPSPFKKKKIIIIIMVRA